MAYGLPLSYTEFSYLHPKPALLQGVRHAPPGLLRQWNLPKAARRQAADPISL
jgi:hypothetical protein